MIVAVILAFIFLTPREKFGDQPRIPGAISLQSGSYWLEPELLRSTPPELQRSRAAAILQAKNKKRQIVDQLQPIYNSEHELQGFIVFTKP